MPILPKKKVGLISCSGEELPAGTLSRVAVLEVLERLRPNDTVTLCLPLFLAGDDKERAFARFYPTMAIDGCAQQCAARATAKYSATPTARIVIPEFLAARGFDAPRSRRQMDAAGARAAEALAQEIAHRVDEILGIQPEPVVVPPAAPAEEPFATATCGCGSGIPVMRLSIAGKPVDVVALPLILEQARRANQSSEEVFDAVKVYNSFPEELEFAYREAVQRAYAVFTHTSEKREE
ncbi:MAG: putative zinc-binding protein [Acidobacteriota bacterium]